VSLWMGSWIEWREPLCCGGRIWYIGENNNETRYEGGLLGNRRTASSLCIYIYIYIYIYVYIYICIYIYIHVYIRGISTHIGGISTEGGLLGVVEQNTRTASSLCM
jgi:hypothetical protein